MESIDCPPAGAAISTSASTDVTLKLRIGYWSWTVSDKNYSQTDTAGYAGSGNLEMLRSAVSLVVLLGIPSLAQAQRPSISAKHLFTTGRDLPSMSGVQVTLRPAGPGVTLSGDWLTGTQTLPTICNIRPDCPPSTTTYDRRSLSASVGYS